jgi:heme oxygenase
MSLKELTALNHAKAENTPFMKAVFAKTLPHDLWVDWTYQKWLFYGAIEGAAGANRLLGDLPDLRRAFYQAMDYAEMNGNNPRHEFRPIVVDYYNYILSISKDPNKIMAHLYTWHMGDMFGGQMIKKIVPGPHRNVEVEEANTVKTNIRAKLDDSMGEEANVAFEWAIRMMRDYDASLGQN